MKKQIRRPVPSKKVMNRVAIRRLLADDNDLGCCEIRTPDSGPRYFQVTERDCEILGLEYEVTPIFSLGEDCEGELEE